MTATTSGGLTSLERLRDAVVRAQPETDGTRRVQWQRHLRTVLVQVERDKGPCLGPTKL